MAEAKNQAEEQEQQAPPLSRREFLYYLWGASMAVFMAGAGGASIWFMLPRFREGEFGGVFTVPIDQIPQTGAEPGDFAAGRFWLVNIGEQSIEDPRRPEDYPAEPGVLALYKVCVHLGCLYGWVSTNDRFECPCHGSKYLLTGERTGGPANRNLDAFIIEVVDAEGNVLSRTEPAMNGREALAVTVPAEAAELRVDTGMRIQGAPNTEPGGGI